MRGWENESCSINQSEIFSHPINISVVLSLSKDVVEMFCCS